MSENVNVKIVEQPEFKFRYRYASEGFHHSIMGVNSTKDKITYPAIRILALDYNGPCTVLVSCVTKDKPYKPHPFRLVGKDCTSIGVCKTDLIIESSSPTVIQYPKLGIQCVKRQEIRSSLTEREELRVDPFRTGFSHKEYHKEIDLNAVRLCFQVFLRTPDKKRLPVKPPLVSDPIHDSKRYSDLVIVDISDVTSSIHGGKKIMIFCKGFINQNIKVRFFEENDDKIILWEDWGVLQKVHRNSSLAFFTPRYKSQDICVPTNVFIQLVLDGYRSAPVLFQYIPDNAYLQKAKKRKIEESREMFEFMQEFQENNKYKMAETEVQTNVKSFLNLEFVPNICFDSDKGDTQQHHGHYSKFPIISNNQQSQEMYQRIPPSCSKLVQQVDPIQHKQEIYQRNNLQSQPSYSQHLKHNEDIYQRINMRCHHLQQMDQLQYNQETYQLSLPQSLCSKRFQDVYKLEHNQASYQSSNLHTQSSCNTVLQQVDRLQQNQEIYKINNDQLLQPSYIEHPKNQSNSESYQTLPNSNLFLNYNLNTKPFCSEMQLPQTHSEQAAYDIQSDVDNNSLNNEHLSMIHDLKGISNLKDEYLLLDL